MWGLIKPHTWFICSISAGKKSVLFPPNTWHYIVQEPARVSIVNIYWFRCIALSYWSKEYVQHDFEKSSEKQWNEFNQLHDPLKEILSSGTCTYIYHFFWSNKVHVHVQEVRLHLILLYSRLLGLSIVTAVCIQCSCINL